MKLLIITQKVNKNDSILGFFHAWIVEFAKYFESIIVVCLEGGEYDLPSNVKVFSLGKEEGENKIKYLINLYKIIWQERVNYDRVFVHMNPEYIVLAGLLWKILNKKIYFWYVHRQVNLKLKVAHFFATHIFSSAPESFGIKSKKVSFVGHGIDLSKLDYNKKEKLNIILNIATVGRITKIKRIEYLIEALRELKNKNINFALNIVGEAVKEEDFIYEKNLRDLIKNSDLEKEIIWRGSLRGEDLKNVYKNSDFTVNLCPTGGMDKVVLESWATGTPCFVVNEAFSGILGESRESFMFEISESQSTAFGASKAEKPSQNGDLTNESLFKKIEDFIQKPNFLAISKISQKVRENFSKEGLIKKVSEKILEKK